MKIADLLRNMIDALDQQSTVDDTVAAPEAEKQIMIPPLQTKLELLKKVTGVESEYDDCSDDEESLSNSMQTASPEDELNRIKQLAGIHISSEDTDAE